MVASIGDRKNLQKAVTAEKRTHETPRKPVFMLAAQTEILN
jgi:hypothetical protein